jgi:hypothetical protein
VRINRSSRSSDFYIRPLDFLAPGTQLRAELADFSALVLNNISSTVMCPSQLTRRSHHVARWSLLKSRPWISSDASYCEYADLEVGHYRTVLQLSYSPDRLFKTATCCRRISLPVADASSAAARLRPGFCFYMMHLKRCLQIQLRPMKRTKVRSGSSPTLEAHKYSPSPSSFSRALPHKAQSSSILIYFFAMASSASQIPKLSLYTNHGTSHRESGRSPGSPRLLT